MIRASKIVHVVSCHAEGEVGDVIVGGVAPPPGDTLSEQSRFIARDGVLRNFVLNEPRGGADGLHHCGTGGHPADVRIQFDLRRNRASRQRHSSDAGAHDASDPQGARMAVMTARGALRPGEVYRARSIIGSEFVCRIARKTTIAGRPAIVPPISGRAWITGVHQHMPEPTDPWPDGYRLADT